MCKQNALGIEQKGAYWFRWDIPIIIAAWN